MRSCIILLYAAALSFVGCRKEAATPPPAQQTETTTASATTTVAEAPKDLSGGNEKINVKLSVEKKVAWQCKAGPTLDAEGLVSEEKNEFTTKEVVHLSMFLREAPPKLAVSAVAYDESGNEVASQQKPAEGATSITLRLGTLKPGKYSVRGYWGGNEACERAVVVK